MSPADASSAAGEREPDAGPTPPPSADAGPIRDAAPPLTPDPSSGAEGGSGGAPGSVDAGVPNGASGAPDSGAGPLVDAGSPLGPYTGPPDPGSSPLMEGPDAFPVLPDPAPVEPLLSEPLPMSGHYVLFVEHNTLVRLLDLETGEIRDLSTVDEPTIYPTTSPDGLSYMFSGTEHYEDAMWHVRFSESTVTPVQQVSGYQGLDGNGTVWDWSFDSRFLRATRYGNRPGLEIIDAHRNERVGGYLFDADIGGTFVPNSYYFWMTEIVESGRLHAIGKITDTGLSERKTLPEGTTGMSFSRDGKRGLLRVETDGENNRYYWFELPGGMQRLEPAGIDPAALLGMAITPEGDSAYALVAEGDSQHFHRVFFDDGRVEPYGDQTLRAFGLRRGTNTDLVALTHQDDEGVFYLSLADGDVVTEAEARPNRDDPGPIYLFGNHYGYGVGNGEWRVAALDDGQLVDTVISEAGEEYFGCMTFTAINPTNRIAVRHQLPVPGLIFVDLSEPVARRVAHFLVEDEGSSVSCPLWAVDGSGCLYIELLADGRQRFRVVRWGPDGPSEPETVYESADAPVPYLMVP